MDRSYALVFSVMYQSFRLENISHGFITVGPLSISWQYCERRYFRVYTFSRISENWQYREDYFCVFDILASIIVTL